MQQFTRIAPKMMLAEFTRILIAVGFSKSRAYECASIFTDNSIDGVYTHGVNRFATFVDYIRRGYIDVHAVPEFTSGDSAFQQWDGNAGPGPLNASYCASKVTGIAREYGIGCIALANTNHWMRGGYYAYQATKAGCAYISWSNTKANMPAWGSSENRLGNTPLVLALPYASETIVLDMAMTQFSFGTLENFKNQGQQLPVPGGFDLSGNLTRDPAEILTSERALPIGYWKGAGLSLLLGMFAPLLSGGLGTHAISSREVETGVSNIFIAIDLTKLPHQHTLANSMKEMINDYLASIPSEAQASVRYPGQRALELRRENNINGIPVATDIWTEIMSLAPAN